MTRSIDVPGLGHGTAPIPYAARVGPLVCSGGISSTDPTTGQVPADFEAQAEGIFANIRRVLTHCGGTVDDIVRITFFVQELSGRPALDAEWLRMFPDAACRPARRIVEQPLRDPHLVQCELLAYVAGESK